MRESPQIGEDEDEDVSILQVSASSRVRHVLHSDDTATEATVRLQVWSDVHASFQLSVPCNASFEEVASLATQQEQREVLPARFIPVFPAPLSAVEFIKCKVGTSAAPMLLRFSNGRWPLVLYWDSAPTTWDLETACACGPLDFFLGDSLWQGPQDGFLPGMCLLASPRAGRPPHPMAFRISLAAALEQRCAKGFASACDLRLLLQAVSTDEWPLTRTHCLGHHAPSVHAAFVSALAMPFTFDMVQCFVFTDGSFQKHPLRVCAGASFNVWFGARQPQFFAGSFACPVDVPPGSLRDAPFIAECTAMQLALVWTLSLPAHVRVYLCFDCQRAGYAADGRWQCSGKDPVALKACQSLRALFLMVQQLRSLEARHIHAHAGHLPNELADAAAKAAALGASSMTVPPHAKSLLEHQALDWAWAAFARVDDGLPALDFLLARCAPAPHPPTQQELGLGVVDVGLPAVAPATSTSVPVRIVTFNVQTANDAKARDKDEFIYGGAKVKAMMEIFSHAGWHIVGLQETRLPTDALFLAQDFLCVQAASDKGHHGVALWIHRSWPAPGGILPQHLTVLHSSPRILLVRCCAPGCKLDFCVAHSPWRDQGDSTCWNWWNSLRTILTAQSNDHYPLVLLADANARVGQAEGSYIGDHQGQEFDINGIGLESVLISRELWLPSTFSSVHQGPGHTHVAVRDDSLHRLDYVAVPLCWEKAVLSSHIAYEIDIGQKRCDHFPAVVEVALELGVHRRPAAKAVDWESGSPSALQDFLASAPVVGWDVSLDGHAHTLTGSLRQAQQICFARKIAKPRKPFVTSPTWEVISERGQLRRGMAQADGQVRRSVLRMIFAAWARGEPRTPALHRSYMHRAKLVRRYQLLCFKLRHMLRQDRDKYLQEAAETGARLLSEGATHQSFQLLNLFRKKSRNVRHQARALPIVEMADGQLASSLQQRADRWLEHFAQVEAAEVVPRELLPIVAGENAGPCRSAWVTNDHGCIPTLHQWESALRRTKRRKHPGPDGIKAELVKLHVPSVAKASFSLVAKMALCCQEPLRFRGGLLAALYKGRGFHRDCANSRSILLANTLSKCYHSCLRAELVPYVKRHMSPAQAGAVAGRTLEAVAMATRAPLEHAAFKRRSAGILYVDIKAAFYSVFRPLLLGNDMSDDFLAYACRYLSIPPVFVEFLRDAVEGSTSNVCMASDVPDDLRRQLAACLHHSWTATANSEGLAYAWAGTRPGDPLGDVLFVMLCSQVLQDVRDRLLHQNLHTVGMESQANLDPCLASPAWVDDVAFFQWACTPQGLLDRMTRLSTIVHNAFGVKGLCLNNKPGKSSVMLVLRGPQARETRQTLEASWDAGLPYPTLAGMQAMPLVKSYKSWTTQRPWSRRSMPASLLPGKRCAPLPSTCLAMLASLWRRGVITSTAWSFPRFPSWQVRGANSARGSPRHGAMVSPHYTAVSSQFAKGTRLPLGPLSGCAGTFTCPTLIPSSHWPVPAFSWPCNKERTPASGTSSQPVVESSLGRLQLLETVSGFAMSWVQGQCTSLTSIFLGHVRETSISRRSSVPFGRTVRAWRAGPRVGA